MAAADDPQITAAVEVLRNGGVLLHATEAVWGLACDAANARAVAAVYALKQRPNDKGLILIADDIDRLADWLAPIAPELMAAARATWPGPHTWVFPARPACPAWLVGARDSVAVRISGHPQVATLAQAFAGVMVSTSANRAGEPPVRHADDIDAQIRGGVDLLLPGATGGQERPTQVRDVRTGAILRA